MYYKYWIYHFYFFDKTLLNSMPVSFPLIFPLICLLDFAFLLVLEFFFLLIDFLDVRMLGSGNVVVCEIFYL